MSKPRFAREPIAALARQAHALLVRVRDSRWPGFEPPAVPRPAPPPKAAAAPATPSARRSPRPTAAPAGAPMPAGAPLLAEPHPWRSLDEIAQAVSSCTKCPLHASRAHAVPGEGSPKPRLLFVGEAPGADEDRLGRPFVGAAGQLLDRMIAAMGLARGDVFIANVLKCRPPGNRNPLPEEVSCCLPYLRAQIELLAPEIVCTLGKHATQALLGVKTPISALRGKFLPLGGAQVMPTFHPSYLLRTPADKKRAWEDLQLVMKRLGLPEPAAPPARENA